MISVVFFSEERDSSVFHAEGKDVSQDSDTL